MNHTVAELEEPQFAQAIWGGRLQMLWVVFAAMYATVGRYYQAKPLASALMLVAGALAVIGAVVSFPTTFAVRALARQTHATTSAYIFGPQGTIALCGLVVGLQLGGRVLSNRTVAYKSIEPKRSVTILWQTLVLCAFVPAALIVANHARVPSTFSSETEAALVAWPYAVSLTLPQALTLAHVHRTAVGDARLLSTRAVYTLLALSGVSGMVNTVLLHATVQTGQAVWFRFVAIELPTAVTVSISMILGLWSVSSLSAHVLGVHQKRPRSEWLVEV